MTFSYSHLGFIISYLIIHTDNLMYKMLLSFSFLFLTFNRYYISKIHFFQHLIN
nr:MAG TPA: hypothetical protein [Caudoviricetes sp.]